MKEPSPSEAVQPCLLDRLIDDQPEARTEGTGRGIALSRYRNGVLRDLEWLLNAKSRLVREAFEQYPDADLSVLNYGMPDPAGKAQSRATVTEIERNILETIRRFEPRIVPHSLAVTAVESTDTKRRGAAPNVLSFQITGELWALPLNEPLHLRTEVDLETGKCRF